MHFFINEVSNEYFSQKHKIDIFLVYCLPCLLTVQFSWHHEWERTALFGYYRPFLLEGRGTLHLDERTYSILAYDAVIDMLGSILLRRNGVWK